MSKYIYQKFLLKCNYEEVEIKDFLRYEGDIDELMDYQSEFCLFDIGKKIVRKISIPEIDDLVDTEEDWKHLLSILNNYDLIVLYDYDIDSSNPIIHFHTTPRESI